MDFTRDICNLNASSQLSTNHIWENSSNPSSACSGLLKTFVSTTTAPFTLVKTEGCLGTPLLLLKEVSMYPIGWKDILLLDWGTEASFLL